MPSSFVDYTAGENGRINSGNLLGQRSEPWPPILHTSSLTLFPWYQTQCQGRVAPRPRRQTHTFVAHGGREKCTKISRDLTTGKTVKAWDHVRSSDDKSRDTLATPRATQHTGFTVRIGLHISPGGCTLTTHCVAIRLHLFKINGKQYHLFCTKYVLWIQDF